MGTMLEQSEEKLHHFTGTKNGMGTAAARVLREDEQHVVGLEGRQPWCNSTIALP